MDQCVDMPKTVPLHRLLVMLIVACYLLCVVSVPLLQYMPWQTSKHSLTPPYMQVDLVLPYCNYLTCHD